MVKIKIPVATLVKSPKIKRMEQTNSANTVKINEICGPSPKKSKTLFRLLPTAVEV